MKRHGAWVGRRLLKESWVEIKRANRRRNMRRGS